MSSTTDRRTDSQNSADAREDQRVGYLAKDENPGGLQPARTALLVIDPVNDFLSEGGAAWDLTKSTVIKNDVIGNLERAIEGARLRGVPVLFGPMAYTEEDYAEAAHHRRSGINRIMFERKMFLAGSWGADFHPDLRPLDDEIVLLPHKGTDVFETDLPEHLRRLGTTHLVIAGMTANLCCESTGRHAVERGFDTIFLWDAIGAENLAAYEASIRINYPLIANGMMNVDQFLSAIDAAKSRETTVRVGDTVRGSDHGEIGTVEQVLEATDEFEACFVVPRGIIFATETYIPSDTVVQRAGTEVFINVPKLIVGNLPWDRRPARADRQQMCGPPAQQVEHLYRSRSPSKVGKRNT